MWVSSLINETVIVAAVCPIIGSHSEQHISHEANVLCALCTWSADSFGLLQVSEHLFGHHNSYSLQLAFSKRRNI
jgi:hypothetical protein